MTKVVILASEIFPPTIGGPARYTALLAAELQRRRIIVKVVTYGATGSDVADYPFPVIVVPNCLPRWVKRCLYGFCLFRYSLLKGAVIYAQGLVAAGLPALVVSFILGIRFVVRIPGDYAWESAHRTKDFAGGPADFAKATSSGRIARLRRTQQLVTRHATVIVTSSQFVRELALNWGTPADRIFIVPNACLPPSDCRNSAGKSRAALLVVGRLVSSKGVVDILRALKALRAEGYGFTLIIIGEGPEEAYLRSQVDALLLSDSVEFTGALPFDQVCRLMREGFALLNNSVYESCPHSVLEALALGLPVVAANTAGTSELLIDGHNALLFRQGVVIDIVAAIARLYNDDELRARLRQNAVPDKRHSPGAVADRLLPLLFGNH